MRDTPDRQLQLDFQRRAPEPWTDCSDLTARASSVFSRHSAHFGKRMPGPNRRFLPFEAVTPLASDAAHPLPRWRVNAAGFNANAEHLRSARAAASSLLTFISGDLACAIPPSAATDGVPTRARQHSPTSAIDTKPEHTSERSLPGHSAAFHDRALRLAARRRCVTAPTIQGLESAPC